MAGGISRGGTSLGASKLIEIAGISRAASNYTFGLSGGTERTD
jgi:hypothetical protein